MKKKELLIAQLKHIEEYVEIINALDPIESWAWGMNYKTGSVELYIGCKKDIHTITVIPVRKMYKNKK